MDDKMITTTDAGEKLGVTGMTIRRWIRAGKLEAIRTVGRQIRVKESSVDALLNELSDVNPLPETQPKQH